MSLKCPFTNFMAGAVSVGVSIYLANYLRRDVDPLEIPAELLKGTSYKEELKVAVRAALAAGANMQREIGMSVKNDVQTKFNSIDFATETDRANEKLIFDMLKQRFPQGHVFIGEESSAENDDIPALTSDPTWIVDPIDGTTNFVHSFPLSCVSIGLCVAGEPVLGVVYCGSTRELFLAAKGSGAFLNGSRISVSAAKSLPEALVLTEFGYSREAKNVDKWLSTARTVVLAGAHGLRSLGSGVIDLCYIAAGRVDAGYAGVSEEGWKPWDYCAGAVILTEAGATLTDIRGDRFDLYGDSILTAATPELAKELLGTLQEAQKVKYQIVKA